jgi:hypothetical protein
MQLKTAKEIFGEFDEGDYCPFYNYSPIIDSFGKVLLQVNEANYQGDSWVIYEAEEDKIAYLNFGWGSCPGCDALQACNTYEDLDNLIKRLYDSIQIFTKEEFKEFILNKEARKGSYSWSSEDFKKFIKQATELLRTEMPEDYFEEEIYYDGD